MTASVATFQGASRFETARISRGTLFYIVCLVTITIGYYMYWWLWKLKAYYIGWTICLVLAAAMLLSDHIRLPRLSREIVPVLAWFAYLLASAFWSPSPTTTLYYYGGDLINLLAFLVAYVWAKSTSEWSLSGFFELQAFMILPVAAVFIVTTGHLFNKEFGAVRSGFAGSCIVALPFLIWRVRRHPGVWTIFILLLALAILLGGESRSALLLTPVLLVGGFFFIGHSSARRAKSLISLVSLLAVIAVVMAFVPAFRNAIATSVDRFGSRETRLSVTSSVLDEVDLPVEVRVDIERRVSLFIAMQSFLSHPIIGGGFQSTLITMTDRFGWEVSAHGLPSTLLGETGLVGTAIFAWMIVTFFRHLNDRTGSRMASRLSEFAPTCKLTMLGLLLLGFFHQVDQNPALFVLLAWGYGGTLPTPRHGATATREVTEHAAGTGAAPVPSPALTS